MISAQQVAQGMALQQQQHAMLTAGASGMMQSQPAMGMSQYPPQFSHAMQGNPNATRSGLAGAAVMGGMAGGLGAINTAANYAAIPSMAAGIGSLGLSGASALGFAAPAGLTAGLSAASGGFMTGLAVPLAGAAAMGATASAVNSGLRQTQQVNQIFGNMQFANMGGDPRTGRGFSQNDLGTLQRGIQAINANNPFVSMSDALRASERFTDMGMHQGVQDAERMARKITEMGKTMHQMARIMGTSMEEAGRALGSMRSSGFYTASDVMGNTASMNLMRGYGMTSDRFMGMQASGAAATRGAQLSGRAGAGFVTGAAADIMGGIRTGALSGEQIMDITGGRDPLEAAQIMAQQSLGATMQGFSGPGGTAILSALGQMKDGRYTGEIDSGLMRQMAEGKLTYQDLVAKGGAKIGSGRNAQASFVANQKDIMDSALQNPEASSALVNLIRSQAKEMFGEGEEYAQLLAETQFNMDRRQFRILSKMAEDRKRGHRERLASLKREMDTSSRAAYIRENRTLGGVLQRATGAASDVWQQSVVGRFSELNRDITEGFQDIERGLFGDIEVGVSAGAMRDAVMEGSFSASASYAARNPVEAARFAMSTGNMSAFTGTLGVSEDKLQKADLESINRGARAAMSAERGGLFGRKMGKLVSSGRSRKLSQLRAKVRRQVPEASESEIDAIIAKSGSAGARLVTQDKSQRSVAGDAGNFLFGGDSSLVDNMQASQDQLGEMSGLDESMSEVAGGAAIYGGAVIAGAGIALALTNPVGWGALALGAAAVSGVGVGASLATLGTLGLGDSDLDDMREDFEKGRAGTDLVAQYKDAKMQKKIDKIIADSHASSSTLKEGNKKAAERLSRVLGRPVSARDVEIADTIMKKRTNKNAAERETLTKAELKKVLEVGEASKNFLVSEAGRRISEEVQGLGTILSDTEDSPLLQKAAEAMRERGDLSSISEALAAASDSGFTAGEGSSPTMQLFGAGVDAYKDLQAAGADGLTLEEMEKITGYDQETLKKVLNQVGVKATGGKVVGARDIKKVTGDLSARMVAGTLAEGKEGVQRVLDSGKSQQQITAEAVKDMAIAVGKSTEMTEALYKTIRGEGMDVQIGKPEEGTE